MLTEEIKSQLLKDAVAATKHTYSSYSNYPVGAALLTNTGEVICGTNIENASFGLTVCAERVAIFKAVSEGYKDFVAIAVVTKDASPPCGACRQVINEFNPNITVLAGDLEGNLVREYHQTELLPNSFSAKKFD